MKSCKPLLKKIGNIVFVAVVVLLVTVAVIALLSRIGGDGRMRIGSYTFGIIVTGSMEPELPTGTFVLIKETDPAALQVGDVITFYSDDPNVPNGELVSHKIVTIDTDAQGLRTFTTKGTANYDVDQYPVSQDKVIGKITWNSDVVGGVIKFAQNKYLYPLLIVILLINLGLNAVAVAHAAKDLHNTSKASEVECSQNQNDNPE